MAVGFWEKKEVRRLFCTATVGVRKGKRGGDFIAQYIGKVVV